MYTQEQLKEAGLDDFRVFLIEVWAFLGLPRPTPVQLDMAYWLQHGPRRVILQAFRGVGKSWLTATYALWCLLVDPNFKIEIISASGSLAEDISKFMKDLIRDMPLLEHLQADEGQRARVISWDVKGAGVSKDPSVKAVGITGQITGTRADLIIADDIEVPKNSFTHHLREKLRNLVTEFDAILKPGGRVVYLGTPQVEESLYPFLSRKQDPNTGSPLYTTRIWPAEIPEDPAKYGENLAPYVVRLPGPPGTPVDPDRFDEIDLAERKASYGASGYSLQFMLDTELASVDRHPLKLSDLIIHDVDRDMAPSKIVWGKDRRLVLEDLSAGGFSGDRYHKPAWVAPEMVPWQGKVMAIDPSGRGRDELAYAIVGHVHGMLYLMDLGGFQDGYGEATLSALAEAAGRWNINAVITERNFGGGMFEQLLKPYLIRVNKETCIDCALKGRNECEHKAGLIDEEYKGWASGQKEVRILNTLEPATQQHRLVVDRRIIEKDIEIQSSHDRSKYSFVQQYTRMEKTRGALPHDDRVEAVSMAVEYFTERMAITQDKAHEARKLAQWREVEREFIRDAIGAKPKKPSYINL